MARELRRGGCSFSITRLTVLKSLCADPVAATRFGMYLTRKSKAKAPKRFIPLINRTIRLVDAHLRSTAARPTETMWDAFSSLQASQSDIEHHPWTDVRIIHSKEALLAEYTLKCVLWPEQSTYWSYQMAAIYADRYNPRYGTGLLPESAPAVEDIVRFWSRYHPFKSGGRTR